MKNILNFLIQVNKLKETPRTGWVWRGVKNPETIADHTFGMAIIVWLLATKKGLNVKRAIKIALSHDLCEVFAGDITPHLYYSRLSKNTKVRQKTLMKWARLTKAEKQKKEKIKFKIEKKGLLKLIRNLPVKQRNEIFSSWFDYERSVSKEGRFVNYLNRIETLIQSIEYFGTENVNEMTGWWEWVEEIVDDPFLLEFLELIQKKFYTRERRYRKERELEAILDFILQVNRLKNLPRLYWKLRGIKNSETVASHIFTVAVMAWVLGKEKKEFDQEKILKMALCHELAAVEIGDTTPYDRILAKKRDETKKILEKMIRLSREEKKNIFIEDYRKEKKAFQKITKKLNPALSQEIINLWEDYRTKKSAEAYFLSQVNTLAVLMQGLLYEKKYKQFSAKPLWEWAFEVCEDPLLIAFMEELKKKFNIKFFQKIFS
jgi:putative hydrolase of HD superfamily